MNGRNKKSAALAAAALQSHLLHNLHLQDPYAAAGSFRARRKTAARSSAANDGRRRSSSSTQARRRTATLGDEYVLDDETAPLTLAERYGLVDRPCKPRLSECEWQRLKHQSAARGHFGQPCAICRDHFKANAQVLLSCGHVFHKDCVKAAECKSSGRKICPLCRQPEYQSRVVHISTLQYLHECATRIQSCWRGFVCRKRYRKWRGKNAPRDPKLRRKYLAEKLKSLGERAQEVFGSSNTDRFLLELERDLEKSRWLTSQLETGAWKARYWPDMLQTIKRRGLVQNCPICLGALSLFNNKSESKTKSKTGGRRCAGNKKESEKCKELARKFERKGGKEKEEGKNEIVRHAGKAPPSNNVELDEAKIGQVYLLSCSHVLHTKCLDRLEQIHGHDSLPCPVCRKTYIKKHVREI